MSKFRALFVNQDADVAVAETDFTALPEGDVTIRVHYSSINYKDALATLPDGKIVTNYPFIPGIDASGIVTESKSSLFKKGDQVIVTSYGLGVSHFGGFSEFIRVPKEWVVPLPENLSLREAMCYGTAGFTAALSVQALLDDGAKPDDGAVAVSGASGGVGSIATGMLAKKGFSVVASSGNSGSKTLLCELGAAQVVTRSDFNPEKKRALNTERFAHAVDCVGGEVLGYLLSATKYGGTVAACGMALSGKLETTVFPFILRGINLRGIDSVYCPYEKRVEIWEHIATDLRVTKLPPLLTEITLDELPEALRKIMDGGIAGRYVVKIAE
ncbi:MULTISPECIES: oxidoreductase [Listeria]|uniref:oxidoreductase n=1 Tax=Listeria TaxID=1637 RepID=UPI000B591514|nr:MULTISPECIES: oxidoreductase [Listeria]